MKKELFRKGSPFTKATAAVLSLTLAFGMTPALALAQPTNEGGGTLSFETNAVTLQDGTYSGTIEQDFDMFTSGTVAAEPYVVVSGDNAYLVYSSSNNRVYPEIAWAKTSDLDQNGNLPEGTQTFNGIPVLQDGVEELDMSSDTAAKACLKGFTYVMTIDKTALQTALGSGSGTYTSPNFLVRYMKGNSDPYDGDWYASKSDHAFRISNLTKTSDSTTVPEAPKNPVDSDGSGDSETTIHPIDADSITNTTDMFKVAAAQIETTNGKSNLRFTLSGSSYVELFMGTYEQCVANGDGTQDKGNNTWIHGVTDPITLSDGKAEFVIPLAQGSGNYAITSISNNHYQKYLAGTEKIGQCMYPRYIKVDADELTLEAGDYSATTTLTVTSSGAIPRITASTLDTVGGPASNNYSETLNLTTDAAAAYVGTAEAAATATEGVAAAADGKITICLTKNNFGGVYAAEGGWTGVTALALKDANGTWVDTTTKVDKATKTLTVEGPDASLEKGQYNITASINKESDHTQFTMYKIGDAALMVTDEGMTLRLKISYGSYKGIFMGPVAKATLDKTIMGTPTTDGFFEYSIPVTADMLNAATSISLLKKDGKTFYTNNALELSLTNVSKQEGISSAAQAVIDAINELPAVQSVTSDDGAAIRAARSDYDKLWDLRKPEVTNYSKLVAVEEAYAKIPIVWPALDTNYGQLNMTDDPYYRVAYTDNNSTLRVKLYVDTRNYNRAFALPESEVTAETTGGTITAVANSDAGIVGANTTGLVLHEVQLGKTYTYTLAKIVDGELKATKEISFTIPSFRKALEANTYAMELQSDCAALNGVAASVTSDGASMTANVTPNAAGAITKMFAGTAEAAAAATEGVIEPDAQGAFTIPVAQADVPLSFAVYDGTKWSDQRIQIVANEQTQSVIQTIQNIYRDGVDDSGNALSRASYWDIYPADRDAVNAANVAYQKLSDEQKLVVGQSNASELLHAVAMFKSADSVSAEIDALPSTPAEVKTQEQKDAIKAAKEHYDTCGDNIFDWYPQGDQGASIQDNYVQKLISQENRDKLSNLYNAIKYDFTVSETSYVEASNMKLVTFVGTVNEGEVPTCKGTSMYKLGDSYVMLASAADAAALAYADFDITEGTAQVISVDGDINKNGNVNIVDAQLAYDIARGVYTDFKAITQEGYLKADVNGDASVDAADAFAIQYYALYGKFGA